MVFSHLSFYVFFRNCVHYQPFPQKNLPKGTLAFCSILYVFWCFHSVYFFKIAAINKTSKSEKNSRCLDFNMYTSKIVYPFVTTTDLRLVTNNPLLWLPINSVTQWLNEIIEFLLQLFSRIDFIFSSWLWRLIVWILTWLYLRTVFNLKLALPLLLLWPEQNGSGIHIFACSEFSPIKISWRNRWNDDN